MEFLYDPAADRFFFLEMNTRLQVEHPVTELVHGVDLVELQLDGGGGPHARPPAIGLTYGHAIEVRLYAEDPAADWQPQSGVLTLVDVPGVDGEFDLLNRPGLRLDAGFETGSEVSTHYDAMLAKVVSWAPTREQAARRLAAALARARIHGVVTNRDLLVDVLEDPHSWPATSSTAYLDRAPRHRGAARRRGRAVAAALALAERDAAARRSSTASRSPGATSSASPSAPASPGSVRPHEVASVEWYGGRATGTSWTGSTVRRRRARPTVGWRVVLERDGVATAYDVPVTGDVVDVDAPTGHVRLTVVPRFTDPADAVASGSLLAPMPGTVVRVAVEEGDVVEAGRPCWCSRR